MIPKVVQTEDGSITCIDTYSGELYHNRIGAYTEALQHYVQACDLSARLKQKSEIYILDVCFGLGYNSFVLIDSLIDHLKNNKITNSPIACHIIGIDQDINILNFIPQVLQDQRFAKLCQALNIIPTIAEILPSQWQNNGKSKFYFKNQPDLSISIEIKIDDLRQVIPRLVDNKQQFDYIFHDGFSPRSMPELWTVDLFKKYAQLISDSGRIITYSSAYAVRGAFLECGLEVRKSAPLGGKSGGTIAFKKGQPEIVDNQSIFFLCDEENARLKTNSAIPYRDPHFNSTRDEIIRCRNNEIRQILL